MSNELDVQNKWEENTHTHTHTLNRWHGRKSPGTTNNSCKTKIYQPLNTNYNIIIYHNVPRTAILSHEIIKDLSVNIIYSRKSMDQPGKVANPARGQLNRENEYFPVRVRA